MLRFGLLGATILAFLSSFCAWRYSPHVEGLRNIYPSWYYGEFVIFDGYGAYSQWLAAVMVGRPGAAAHLAEFLRYDPHAHTPLYPFLCALVILLVGNVVFAQLVVTVLASLASLWLFWVLLRTQWPTCSLSVRWLSYLGFLFHPGVTSGLARPMPDSLALALQLGVLLALVRFQKSGRRRMLVVAGVLTLCAILTKMVMVLLVPTTFVWWALEYVRTHDTPIVRKRLLSIGAPLLGFVAVVAAFVWWSLRDTHAMKFLATAMTHAAHTLTTPSLLLSHTPAFALFLVIGFGFYPLLWSKVRVKPEEKPAVRLHGTWVGIYLLQRVFFAGFNLAYGRARYTMPLAPAVLLFSTPALEEYWRRGGKWRIAAVAPACFHLAIWCAHLLTLRGSVTG